MAYGIENGQTYVPADGTKGDRLVVVDCHTFSDVDDVVVRDEDGNERRIDAFKLAVVRYSLVQSN